MPKQKSEIIMKNPYRPILTTIENITIENQDGDLKTFRLAFCNDEEANNFHFQCGQFAELTVFGVGECPIGIASSPMDRAFLEFTVKRYPDGLVTNALHNCSVGSRAAPTGLGLCPEACRVNRENMQQSHVRTFFIPADVFSSTRSKQ